jgi:hypothetical protein
MTKKPRTGPWLTRWNDAAMPYQNWHVFHPMAIVQVRGRYEARIAQVKDLWWGYEEEGSGNIGEGVILQARCLSHTILAPARRHDLVTTGPLSQRCPTCKAAPFEACIPTSNAPPALTWGDGNHYARMNLTRSAREA